MQSVSGDDLEFLPVVGNASTRAAKGIGGADDKGVGADSPGDLKDLVNRVGRSGVGNLESDFEHDLLEKGAVLTPLDRLGISSDEADGVFRQHSAVDKFHGRVEGGLAAKRRKEGVGLLPFDDLLDD